MKNPHVIWASVVVVLMLVASATTLVILDKDVAIILTLAGIVAVPLLGAFGVAIYQKLDQVKEQGNGNMNRQAELTRQVLEMQQTTQNQLHALAMSRTPAPVREEEKLTNDESSAVLLRPPGRLERS